jgi:hypothetical protein
MKTFDEVMDDILPEDGSQPKHDPTKFDEIGVEIYDSERTMDLAFKIFAAAMMDKMREAGESKARITIPAEVAHLIKMGICNGVLIGIEMEKES